MPESPEAFEAPRESEPVEVFVSSGYGAMTQRPYVSLSVGETTVQMGPNAARGIGMDLIAAAEGAMTDAFLVEFFREHMGQDRDTCAHVIQLRRNWRAAQDSPEEGAQ